ncbi:hypothetical protein [Caudoviricetes sp.]|nr:hypothetical protein [Caudoviricetes sp.]
MSRIAEILARKNSTPSNGDWWEDAKNEDEKFCDSLKKLGIAQDIIDDCLFEPVERRAELLDYFKSIKVQNER